MNNTNETVKTNKSVRFEELGGIDDDKPYAAKHYMTKYRTAKRIRTIKIADEKQHVIKPIKIAVEKQHVIKPIQRTWVKCSIGYYTEHLYCPGLFELNWFLPDSVLDGYAGNFTMEEINKQIAEEEEYEKNRRIKSEQRKKTRQNKNLRLKKCLEENPNVDIKVVLDEEFVKAITNRANVMFDKPQYYFVPSGPHVKNNFIKKELRKARTKLRKQKIRDILQTMA